MINTGRVNPGIYASVIIFLKSSIDRNRWGICTYAYCTTYVIRTLYVFIHIYIYIYTYTNMYRRRAAAASDRYHRTPRNGTETGKCVRVS